MKGRKKAHELPLSPPARAILEARKRTATSDLVFPTADGAPFTNWDRLLTRIRKAIGEDKNDRAARVLASRHPPRVRQSPRRLVRRRPASINAWATRAAACLAFTSAVRAGPSVSRALNAWADLILDVVEDRNVVPFARRADV